MLYCGVYSLVLVCHVVLCDVLVYITLHCLYSMFSYFAIVYYVALFPRKMDYTIFYYIHVQYIRLYDKLLHFI